MAYELIIAEKPNAAKKIAESLCDGKPVVENKQGIKNYIISHKGKDIIVASAVGHLYSLEQKDNKNKSKYPVFDIKWAPSFKINKTAAFTKKYVDNLKKIAKNAKEITVATDFDIEGEVIGYNVVKNICKVKDANRMKFSTLTKPDLIKSYENKQNHLNWSIIEAGVTRHKLDWFYGINISRALMSAIKTSGMFKVMSSGRVQGPALKILEEREEEINAFKPKPYWEIQGNFDKNNKIILAKHKTGKFWDKTEVEKIFKTIKNETEAIVKKVSDKTTKVQPPHPFDLTSLQIEAYRCFHINPKQTLEIAQELYTQGYMSYPRTSSQIYKKEIGYDKIILEIKKNKNYSKDVEYVFEKLDPKKGLSPNNGKKDDPAHPAIYPTGIIPSNLTDQEAKIYDLVVRRFLATFSDIAERKTIKAEIHVKNEPFISKGSITSYKGWLTVYGKYNSYKDDEIVELTEKENIKINKIETIEKETKPPKRYTQSSLIKELEKKNLGTKATRASIIDTLFKRGYLDGNPIKVTEMGMRTIKILKKYIPDIVDPDLTKTIEENMEKIEEKKIEGDKVLDQAKKIIIKSLDKFDKQKIEVGTELRKATVETRDELTTLGLCPNCKKGNLIIRSGRFGKFVACNLYPECKTTISLPKGALYKPAKKMCEICGWPMIIAVRKGKKPQEICLNKDCSSKGEEIDVKGKFCPNCGSNLIVRKSLFGSFVGCSNYPKCKYIEPSKEFETKDDKEQSNKKSKNENDETNKISENKEDKKKKSGKKKILTKNKK